MFLPMIDMAESGAFFIIGYAGANAGMWVTSGEKALKSRRILGKMTGNLKARDCLAPRRGRDEFEA